MARIFYLVGLLTVLILGIFFLQMRYTVSLLICLPLWFLIERRLLSPVIKKAISLVPFIRLNSQLMVMFIEGCIAVVSILVALSMLTTLFYEFGIFLTIFTVGLIVMRWGSIMYSEKFNAAINTTLILPVVTMAYLLPQLFFQ